MDLDEACDLVFILNSLCSLSLLVRKEKSFSQTIKKRAEA
jgi:hypothetical protein